MRKERIVILGSTGSIGQSTLNVIAQHPNQYEVVALSANTAHESLFLQCVDFKPQYAVMVCPKAAKQLKQQIVMHGLSTQVLVGADALNDIVQLPEVDKVVAAIVGSAGLMSTLSAVLAKKQILLANKEALVMAGEYLLAQARKTGALFLPVDSEHNAIFQCMPAGYQTGHRHASVRELQLTASGGPFLHHPLADLPDVTPAMALKHPNWQMGKKITIDCATLMNKGLEVIEACRLFQMPSEQVKVIIHPQSVIHSIVAYQDGSCLAQLGVPDMRIPIASCLGWPSRIHSGASSLSLVDIAQLTFFAPDTNRFPCLQLAYDALNGSASDTVVLNASNEVAVDAFLRGEVQFTDIPDIVERALNEMKNASADSLEEIIETDSITREIAKGFIEKRIRILVH